MKDGDGLRKLRIDFRVKEILPEDRDPADARYVTFGDDVDPMLIKDFFARCGIACDIVLGSGSLEPAFVRFTALPLAGKIPAIKVMRRLANLGLKEAKDRVELPVGTPLVFFRTLSDTRKGLDAFNAAGVYEVDALSCALEAMVSANVPEFDRVNFR